ncbi:hypothetical protein VTO73DRAFT_14461 [Trametes versicolor]
MSTARQRHTGAQTLGSNERARSARHPALSATTTFHAPYATRRAPRRKTVTWDARCDVLFDVGENEHQDVYHSEDDYGTPSDEEMQDSFEYGAPLDDSIVSKVDSMIHETQPHTPPRPEDEQDAALLPPSPSPAKTRSAAPHHEYSEPPGGADDRDFARLEHVSVFGDEHISAALGMRAMVVRRANTSPKPVAREGGVHLGDVSALGRLMEDMAQGVQMDPGADLSSRLASPSTHRFGMASMYIRTPGELRMVLSSTWLSITFTPELESPLLPARPLHLNVTTTLEGVVLTLSAARAGCTPLLSRLPSADVVLACNTRSSSVRDLAQHRTQEHDVRVLATLGNHTNKITPFPNTYEHSEFRPFRRSSYRTIHPPWLTAPRYLDLTRPRPDATRVFDAVGRQYDHSAPRALARSHPICSQLRTPQYTHARASAAPDTCGGCFRVRTRALAHFVHGHAASLATECAPFGCVSRRRWGASKSRIERDPPRDLIGSGLTRG